APLISKREFFTEVVPVVFGNGNILNSVPAFFRIAEIKRAKIDGIVGSAVESVKGETNEALAHQVFPPDIELYGSVFKERIVEYKQSIARLSIEMNRSPTKMRLTVVGFPL